ncbi:YqhV family protein [Paenibacillus sp. TRM 82003]|nr:YqhV family protein [Paenibacillus sp. TRM 82003]
MISKIVFSMAMLRVLSGTIELVAAFLIYRFNNVEKALVINSSLALVGPLIFMSITTLGLIGVADKLSFGKLAWVGVGVTCLLIGIMKK